MDRLRSGLLDGNGPDLARPLEEFRAKAPDESGQSPDSGEPLIACGRAAIAFLFQLPQEPFDDFSGDIFDAQIIDGPGNTSRCVGKQEAQCVPITPLGIARQIPLADKVLK
jgi:hypothetical protein